MFVMWLHTLVSTLLLQAVLSMMRHARSLEKSIDKPATSAATTIGACSYLNLSTAQWICKLWLLYDNGIVLVQLSEMTLQLTMAHHNLSLQQLISMAQTIIHNRQQQAEQQQQAAMASQLQSHPVFARLNPEQQRQLTAMQPHQIRQACFLCCLHCCPNRIRTPLILLGFRSACVLVIQTPVQPSVLVSNVDNMISTLVLRCTSGPRWSTVCFLELCHLR